MGRLSDTCPEETGLDEFADGAGERWRLNAPCGGVLRFSDCGMMLVISAMVAASE